MAEQRESGYRLDWDPEDLTEKAIAAARRGIYDTLADTATVARVSNKAGGLTPYDTGTMAGNIVPHPRKGGPQRDGTRIVGWVGNVDQNYTLYQELKWKFLRTAGDQIFPTLGSRVRANMASGRGMPESETPNERRFE